MKITGVTFIALNPAGAMLMQLRDAHSERYPHMWCFPGGTIDSNEEPSETVIREIKEEYELVIKESDCTELMVYNLPYGVSAKVYVCRLAQGQTPVLNEGADMKWMEMEEIEKLQLGFGQQVILPELKEYLQHGRADIHTKDRTA